MIKLDNETNVSTGASINLQARALPQGFFVRRFWLRVTMTLTRGGVPVAHQPEAVAEVISKVYTNQGNLRYDLGGRDILVLHNQRYRSRCSQNAFCDITTTSYILYIPIDPSPFAGYPGDAGDRMRTSKLLNQTFTITTQNPFAAADVSAITFSEIALFGTFTHVGPSTDKNKIATFQRISTIQKDILTIDTVQPAILLLESRTDYSRMDVTATDKETGGGLIIAQDCTALDLDTKDEEYDVYLADEADRASAGNQLLLDVPLADGTTESYAKPVDIRNDKSALPPYSLKFTDKTGDFAYLYCGYVVG